jgi:hypothetical protein
MQRREGKKMRLILLLSDSIVCICGGTVCVFGSIMRISGSTVRICGGTGHVCGSTVCICCSIVRISVSKVRITGGTGRICGGMWRYRAHMWRHSAHMWQYIVCIWQFSAHICQYSAHVWRYNVHMWQYIMRICGTNYELMTWCIRSLVLWGLLWNIILSIRSATLINGNLFGTEEECGTFRISFQAFFLSTVRVCTYVIWRTNEEHDAGAHIWAGTLDGKGPRDRRNCD